jgi:hypothetical protein
MLMSPHNGGVDHHEFVVVITRQQLENALKNSALRPPVEALVDDVPVAETLRKIAPGNAGSEPIDNRIDEQPVVRRRAANVALPARQKILDPLPLVVAYRITAHRSAPPYIRPTVHESLNN